jgi:hypothetical protein
MWRRSRDAPMSDNLRNAGPAGQPSATAPSSGPLSPPRNLVPWPAPGESRVRGPLSTDPVDVAKHSHVFCRPTYPAAKAIELVLEHIRLDQDRDRLKRATEQLARDKAETEELVRQLERLREQPQARPEPKPERPLGRPSVIAGDLETLRRLRDEHPGSDCRAEFYATLPKGIKQRQVQQRYRDATEELRKRDKRDK